MVLQAHTGFARLCLKVSEHETCIGQRSLGMNKAAPPVSATLATHQLLFLKATAFIASWSTESHHPLFLSLYSHRLELTASLLLSYTLYLLVNVVVSYLEMVVLTRSQAKSKQQATASPKVITTVDASAVCLC